MKEFFKNIGFGLLCLTGAGVFVTPVIALAIWANRYPVTVGVPCLLFYTIAFAWVIGRIGREPA